MTDKPKTNRILTPEEATALSGPAVQFEIARINQGLKQGVRSFWIPEPLWPAIRAELEANGWMCVQQHLVVLGVISCTLAPAPPSPQPNEEELVGAYRSVIAKGNCS